MLSLDTLLPMFRTTRLHCGPAEKISFDLLISSRRPSSVGVGWQFVMGPLSYLTCSAAISFYRWKIAIGSTLSTLELYFLAQAAHGICPYSLARVICHAVVKNFRIFACSDSDAP